MLNNKYLQNLSTRDVLSGLMNGKFPIQDTNTKGYYYLQSKRNQYGQEEDEMERINVPSASSPNPTWNNQNFQNGTATSPYNSTSMGWNRPLDATSSTANTAGTQYAANGNTGMAITNQGTPPNDHSYFDNKNGVWCDKNTGFENPQYDADKYGADISEDMVNKMMQDKEFQRAMTTYTIPEEGCYNNAPTDRGKETKYGITKRWYKNEDIPNLSRERANAILYRDYWNYNGINKLPSGVAGAVFDNAVNQGQPTAVKNTHRALGIVPGDIIGNQTLNAINNANQQEFLQNFQDEANQINQGNIRNTPQQATFENGWNNRIRRWRVLPPLQGRF